MQIKFRKVNNQKELIILVSDRTIKFPQYSFLFNYCRKNHIKLNISEVM